MQALAQAAQRALDLLFPPRCASCGMVGALLCVRCLASIHAPAPPLCPRCGRSLAEGTEQADASAPTSLCRACAMGDQPRALDGLRAASVYEGAVRKAILALKFHRARRLAGPLADVLAACYAAEALHADLLVPVPLHPIRRRERGYDQAELLARALENRLRLPLRADLLRRHRATAPQTTLSREERRANVAGAFAVTSPAAVRLLAGKHILLVDDVTTTGSTLDAAAAALRDARPATVWGLAAARPIPAGEATYEDEAVAAARAARRRATRRMG